MRVRHAGDMFTPRQPRCLRRNGGRSRGGEGGPATRGAEQNRALVTAGRETKSAPP